MYCDIFSVGAYSGFRTNTRHSTNQELAVDLVAFHINIRPSFIKLLNFIVIKIFY